MQVGPKLFAQEAYSPNLFNSLKFNSPFAAGLVPVLSYGQPCHPLGGQRRLVRLNGTRSNIRGQDSQ